MATTATAIGTLPLRRPNLIAICAKKAKYEFLKCLRLPMYSVSTLVFPLMFYVLFGLVMGKQTIGNIGYYFNSQRMMRRYASEAYLR